MGDEARNVRCGEEDTAEGRRGSVNVLMVDKNSGHTVLLDDFVRGIRRDDEIL